MINLRLAEYDLETGKFVRFLELGKDFVYGGDFVGVYPQTALQAIRKCTIFSSDNFYKFEKGETDPLNRFNGLFDGRTYSNGQFVLIRSVHAGFYEDSIIDDNMGVSEKIDLRLLIWGKRGGFINIYSEELLSFDEDTAEYLGNLHENPELYEKIYSLQWS